MALTRINNQALPTGSIIQVATDTSGTNTTVTGTTYTASDVSITFTPKKSNSTILLMWSGNVSQQTSGANGFGLAFLKEVHSLIVNRQIAQALLLSTKMKVVFSLMSQ